VVGASTTQAFLQLGVTNANITGSANSDLIITGAGNDSIVGGAGADTISTGAGNDQVIVTQAQLGTATLNGGDGVDTLFVNSGAAGATTIGTVTNFENITFDTGTFNVAGFTNASTTVTSVINGANTTALTFTGSGGAISVTGGAGGDTLTTGAGNDTLIGGAGGDTLAAGNGVNLIIGGTGVDAMSGGTGIDTFRFAAGDTGQTGATLDTITGFATASDVIDYATAITFQAGGATTTAGTAQISATGIATFNGADTTFDARLAAVSNAVTLGTNTAGETAIFEQGGNTFVFISDGVNGVGSNDVVIQLTGVTNVTAGNVNAAGDLTLTF